MKANAKPAWKCVWPRREEEEEEEENATGESEYWRKNQSTSVMIYSTF